MPKKSDKLRAAEKLTGLKLSDDYSKLGRGVRVWFSDEGKIGTYVGSSGNYSTDAWYDFGEPVMIKVQDACKHCGAPDLWRETYDPQYKCYNNGYRHKYIYDSGGFIILD